MTERRRSYTHRVGPWLCSVVRRFGARRCQERTDPVTTPHFVIAGLDPAIHGEPHVSMDHRVIGERSDAVLRTAMPGGDEECRRRNAPVLVVSRNGAPNDFARF